MSWVALFFSLTERRLSSRWCYLWRDDCADTGRICSTLAVLTRSFRLSAASLRNSKQSRCRQQQSCISVERSAKVGSKEANSSALLVRRELAVFWPWEAIVGSQRLPERASSSFEGLTITASGIDMCVANSFDLSSAGCRD